MARRPSLTQAGVTRPSFALAPPEAEDTVGDAKRAAVRHGKKAVACWIDPAAALQLRSAALTNGRTLQAVMEEAIDDWFRKHGLAPIAGSQP
jgi:hypothetical protein